MKKRQSVALVSEAGRRTIAMMCDERITPRWKRRPNELPPI
jgi:hypothetical protein